MSSLLSWLRSFAISRTTRTARRRCFSHRPVRPRYIRPRLEALEDRLTPSGPTLTTLATFNGTNGQAPQAGLIMDGSGNLYGTTSSGGASSDGTVFEVAKGSSTITTLASFNGTNGSIPQAGLLMDKSSGNLYGTTASGGANNDGTVFELAKGSSTIATLASFNGTNGLAPQGSLIMDSSGNLYGTTSSGGASGDGTLFEWVKSSGALTTLATFNGSNGTGPQDGLIMDGSGNLYGTTSSGGGASNGGTLFEWVKSSGNITTLTTFNGSNGASPQPNLIMDSSGNLYGTTQLGGASGGGEVFEWVKSSGALTTLAWFNDSNGVSPSGGLIMDGSGNLYGATLAGGTGTSPGTVFESVKNSGATTALASFDNTSGGGSMGGLVMDGSGNLYGTTFQGGANGDGTVFEVQGINSQTTDQWTGANFAVDTNWSDGKNWSLGAPPTDGQIALFTNNSSVKDFTATVDSGFSNAIASFVIDSSWGGTINVNNNLTVNGNFTMASGTFGGSGAVTIGGPASQWTGGTINLAGGSFTNNGVLTADTSGGNLVLTGNGTFFNEGNGAGQTIVEAGTNTLELENGATLENLGTFDLTNNGNISQSNGGTFLNQGTLEKTGGTSTSTISSSFVNEASVTNAITVQTGTLVLASAGGTSTGGTINVSKNATLDLTGGNTVAYTGTYTGSGSGTVALKSGTLQVATGGATFNMAGSVFQWTGGTIDVTNGNFTNTNTITYSGTGNVVVSGAGSGAGSLVNKKTINQTSSGNLLLENGATLNNAAGSTYNIESNGGIGQSGGGTLTNAGTLEKTKGTGTTTIASSTLSNTGTVKVTTGTLDISATVNQVSGTTLTAGSWSVTGSATVSSKLDITSAGSIGTIGGAAHVTLSGLNTTFTNLSALSSIAKGGSFSLLGGQSFTTTGALTNNGSLTLGPASVLTVGGSFTQSSTASLAIQLGGTDSAPTFGQLVSTTGSVALAGKLTVTSTVVPAVGSSFVVLDNEGNAAIGGTFSNLPEGATFTVKKGTTTMTFQVSYVGNDGDGSNNVTITRIS